MRLTAETSGGRGGLRRGVRARSERYICVEERERASGTKVTSQRGKKKKTPVYIIARSM